MNPEGDVRTTNHTDPLHGVPGAADGSIRMSDVEKLLGSRMPAFHYWFVGQTGPMFPDGELGVYASDLRRFLAGKDDAEWIA